MFQRLKEFFTEQLGVDTMPQGQIMQDTEGRFMICDRRGYALADRSYTRKRDARRGAERLGITVL